MLSSLPNLSILAPCDPLELVDATKYCATANGPVYLRIGKSGEPTFTDKAVEPFEFGKIRYIKRGADACVISFGHAMDLGADVVERLEADGRSVSLVSCHTLKPIDSTGIASMLHQHEEVIVVEEHSCVGGLAAKVKEIAWESSAPCKLSTFSMKDEFIHVYGSHTELRAAHGLSTDAICESLTT